MRLADFMGDLHEINRSMRRDVSGTQRYEGDGYRGERRLRAKLAYRAAKKAAKAKRARAA